MTPYLGTSALTPISREEVYTATTATADCRSNEFLLEVSGVGDLESRPSSCQHVSEQGSQNMGDGLVEDGHCRHSKNPELEGEECDIFTLGVVNPVLLLF